MFHTIKTHGLMTSSLWVLEKIRKITKSKIKQRNWVSNQISPNIHLSDLMLTFLKSVSVTDLTGDKIKVTGHSVTELEVTCQISLINHLSNLMISFLKSVSPTDLTGTFRSLTPHFITEFVTGVTCQRETVWQVEFDTSKTSDNHLSFLKFLDT